MSKKNKNNPKQQIKHVVVKKQKNNSGQLISEKPDYTINNYQINKQKKENTIERLYEILIDDMNKYLINKEILEKSINEDEVLNENAKAKSLIAGFEKFLRIVKLYESLTNMLEKYIEGYTNKIDEYKLTEQMSKFEQAIV